MTDVTRRKLILGAGTVLGCSSMANAALLQPAKFCVKIRDGMGNLLPNCFVDLWTLGGGIQRGRTDAKGECVFDVKASECTLVIYRDQTKMPELVIKHVWGLESVQLALKLPGDESEESKLQRLVSQLNSCIALLNSAGPNPSIREYLRSLKINWERECRRIISGIRSSDVDVISPSTDDIWLLARKLGL